MTPTMMTGILPVVPIALYLQYCRLQVVINRIALTKGSKTLYCNFMAMVGCLYQMLNNEEQYVLRVEAGAILSIRRGTKKSQMPLQ
jgi:hypothetical protein